MVVESYVGDIGPMALLLEFSHWYDHPGWLGIKKQVLHTPCYLTGEFLLRSLLIPFKCKLFPFDQFAHQTAVIAMQPCVALVLLWVHDGRVVMLEAFWW